MSNPIITVRDLGKCYHLGAALQHDTLRDHIAHGFARLFNPRGSKRSKTAPGDDIFWALKDVSFDVNEGEVVGIIGLNGAGKSTILKILSQITEPSEGEVRIKGRIACLLEVGTGFHSELSGRENIFLNGAILGMSKQEIKRKFDEIVAFAEVEKFLDTPVKRYSSGMYVRLAFAVAAHLEPEILIVDEVLAVGDAQFQSKCMNKMRDVASEGRTVLLVSHQMVAIQKLCTRALFLKQGRIEFDGATMSGIEAYMQHCKLMATQTSFEHLPRSGTGDIRLVSFSVENAQGLKTSSVNGGEDVTLVFQYQCNSDSPPRNLSIGFSLHSQMGETYSILYSDYVGKVFSDIPRTGCFKCKVPAFPFSAGRYFVGARLVAHHEEIDWPKGFLGEINVQGQDFYNAGIVPKSGIGPILIRGEFSVCEEEKLPG